MSVRIAVIGAGVMGADHARIIADDIPGASLQVVCDLSEDAARRIADAYSAQHVETNSLDTIQRNDVDAIIIASPDPTHAELTLEALKLEKPVLCEKPLASTSRECLYVMEAETGLGKQLVQVGFMRRFDHAYTEMKFTLTSGDIGKAIIMHNFHRNVEEPTPEFTGEMAITNSAPHEFDAVRYILDTEIASISAFEASIESTGPCKPVVMVLQTVEGQLVTIEVNNIAAYGYDVRGELVGTNGSVSLGSHFPVTVDKHLNSSTAYAQDWRPRFAEAYRLQDKAWIKSVNTGVPSPLAANAWDGYCASMIAEAGANALSKGHKIDITLAEQPGLYKDV